MFRLGKVLPLIVGSPYWMMSNVCADDNDSMVKHYSCVVVGGGWSGIGVGSSLKANNVNDYIILEKGNCIGYFWSQLYDSIEMNTFKHRLYKSPKQIEINDNTPYYRTKENVLNYLQKYSDYYDNTKHIQFNSNVNHIHYNHNDDVWEITYNDNSKLTASYLVMATSINRVRDCISMYHRSLFIHRYICP